jgi:hypothetical protein
VPTASRRARRPPAPGWTQCDYLSAVMAGLVPAIHVFFAAKESVEGRDKRGHDDERAGGFQERIAGPESAKWHATA